MIRVLALDHFSAQDREALVNASADRFRWRVIPYWRFRNGANAIFPEAVREGLEAYVRPEFEAQRAAFRKWLREELGRIYVEWPFDLVVLPSDAYYYVRLLPELAHELGTPVVVVQKETTITEETFRRHAPSVESYAPFISDWMTVCSDRHKRFWVEAGADPDRIEVTGQPRFDLYASGAQRAAHGRVRTILFLSYERDAYLLDGRDRAEGWEQLLRETEAVLVEATRRGVGVVVKLHPLQNWNEEQRRLQVLGERTGGPLKLAPPGADTRRLILDADAVVGFQTTALYEAMVAGKPVAYTAWTPLYERVASQLIPFESRPDVLDVIRSPEQLEAWLSARVESSAEMMARRREFTEEMLGPIDGRASERTLAAIAGVGAAWEEERRRSRRRRSLQRRVRPTAAWTAGRSLARLCAWSVLSRVERVRRGARYRADLAREQLRVSLETLRSVRG
jgi:hypothetical protein